MSRTDLSGANIAIFGLGRSGTAVGKAASRLGATAEAYDQAPESFSKNPGALRELRDAGVGITFGWNGEFDRLPDILVTNPAIDMRNPILQRAVSDGVEVVSEIEFAYRISEAPIVAITGTNGKSTSTVMAWHILKAAEQDPVLCGNIYGTGYEEVPLTEVALSARPDQVLVAEVSSFQLEWVREFKPACAAITNIAHDHLNRYDSFEQYAQTKLRIFDAMSPEDTAVVRSGDPVVTPPKVPRVKTFGSSGEHAFAVGHKLVIEDHEIDTALLPFEGVHNYLNAMLAGLVATSFVGDAKEHLHFVRDGLMEFRGLEHRMERVGERDGIIVINNSMCTNPQAVLTSCMSIDRPLHVLMGGENKDLDFTPLRELFEGTHNRGYAFGAAANTLAQQADGEIEVVETLQEAFQASLRQVLPGEIIILAPGCASTDQFQDFRERGTVFKRLAKEWLDDAKDIKAT